MDTEQLAQYYAVARWIAEDIAGTIQPEEKEELERWLQQDPQHAEIYSHIAGRLEKGEDLKSYRYAPLIKSDWEKVKKQVCSPYERKKIGMSFYRYAAVIVLLVGVGFAFFHLKSRTPVIGNRSQVGQTSILAGSSKAVLTLASGEKVMLEEITTDSIQADGILIEKKEGRLSYQQADAGKEDEQEIFNVIDIPHGGEYRLTLSDGTKVWLNSATELKYPVKFVGDERVVHIRGEAYFEVARNPRKPFVVKTGHQMEVKVLGTHFNVSAYEEDRTIATTLAEGKVLVTDGKQMIDLVPNQQAVFEKTTGHFTRRDVDAYPYLSWKDGKFIFENETLENIMERVSRWYDVEVFFKGMAVRELRFSGDLEKYDDFSTLVRMLEKVSRIRIEIKDKAVFIEKR